MREGRESSKYVTTAVAVLPKSRQPSRNDVRVSYTAKSEHNARVLEKNRSFPVVARQYHSISCQITFTPQEIFTDLDTAIFGE